MNFFTPAQKQQLLDNGRPGNRDKDHAPVVRLFLPGTGCVWLLSELDPEEPDIAFGLCDLDMGFPELGSVSLAELASVSVGPGIVVRADPHFRAGYPMSVFATAARNSQAITDDPYALKEASLQLNCTRSKNVPRPG